MKEYGVIIGGLVKPDKVVYTQIPPSWYINNILKAAQRLYTFNYEIFRQCCFQIIVQPDQTTELVDTIKKAFEDHDLPVYIEYGTGKIEHLGATPGLSYGPVLTKVGRSFDSHYFIPMQ